MGDIQIHIKNIYDEIILGSAINIFCWTTENNFISTF